MKGILLLILLLVCTLKTVAQGAISAATYPLTINNGIALEDMSTGTTQLIGPGTDEGGTGSLRNIGFDFFMATQRYTQYDASANGYIRLGGLILSPGTATDFTNSLGTSNQSPCIALYWDDIYVGSTGKVHTKTIGAAPNRKLIIEWLNMQVPIVGTNVPGNATFQLWLTETSGKIEFVYGNGLVTNSTQGGYSAGINTVLFSTLLASISTNTGAVSYTTANNANTLALPAGRKYNLTPVTPNAPTNLTFTSVTGTSMVLNWTDNASNESCYLIYRSDDGGATYQFIIKTATANTITSTQNNLQPGTTYFWRVYALNEGAQSTPLTGSRITAAITNITSNGTGGGNWSNPATWATGLVPTDASIVTIKDGDLVTIDVAANASSLAVGEGTGGGLVFEAVTARTLTVFNNLQINNGASFTTAAAGTITTHIVNLYGNLLNSGTLDFAVGTSEAGLTMVGTGNSLISGTGTVTDISKLIVSKQSEAQLVELDVSNFSVRGASNGATSGFLTLTTGTFKISGTNTFSGNLSATAAYGIFFNCTLWLNNPNFTVLGQNGDITLNGTFRLSQGTFNAGNTNGNIFNAAATVCNVIVEGGTFNIASRYNGAGVFIQLGGNINVCTIANNSVNASFNMTAGSCTISGGNITMVQANSNATAASRRDYLNFSVIKNYTGGTLIVGTAATTGNSGNFNFRVYGSAAGLVIDNTVNPKTVSAGVSGIASGSLVLEFFGDALINPGTTFDLADYRTSFSNGTLTNNGAITGSTSGCDLRFGNGGSNGVTYTGSGVANPIAQVSINQAGGLTLNAALTNNITAKRINLIFGSVTNANKITLQGDVGSPGVIQVGSLLGNSNPGLFDVPPTFNLGSDGQSLIYGGTTTSRTTGNEINPTRILKDLTINNTQLAITLAGGDLQLTGTLTLTNGNINLSGSTLTLGSNAASTGALTLTSATSVLYNGKFKRWVSTGSTSTTIFPVGIVSARKSISITYPAGATTGGTLSAEWISTAGGNNGLPLTEGSLQVNSTSEDGFWRITSGDGISTKNYTATANPTSITSVTDFTKLVLVKRVDNVSPWVLDGTHITTTGSNTSPVLSRSGMSGFGEFGVGLPQGGPSLTTSWTGAVNTAWENAANWSDGVPGSVTMVTIPAGMPRYPFINVNTSVKSLSVATGASINVTAGVNVVILSN